MVKLLLAISDKNVGVVLSEYLRSRGFYVDYQATMSESYAAAAKGAYDFCLVGLDVFSDQCQLISDIRHSCTTPVFAIENTFDKDVQIALFEAGADDCLVQPLMPDLLVLQMEAMLRRQNRYEATLPTHFSCGDVEFDSVSQVLRVNDNEYQLSARENNVLLLLWRHQNQLVERSLILKKVWQADNYFNSRSLAVYINHLRKYFESSRFVKIMSMRGQGYKLTITGVM